MSLAEVMGYLQQNYILGISVCSAVVIAVYLVISICILLKARKWDIDVCASAMIPIYNLTLVIRVVLKKIQYKKSLEEEEIEL